MIFFQILPKKSVKEKGLKRLRQEGKILSSMDHPNIVKFIDVIETDKKIFIVMEIINGGSLR